MAEVTLTPADFTAWDIDEPDKLAVLIEDVLAAAKSVAPCLTDPTFEYDGAAKALLREAVLRRIDVGTGAIVTRQQGTGPFSETVTTDTKLRRAILQPSDIVELERLCRLHNGNVGPRAGAVNLDGSANAPEVAPPQFWDRPDLWFQHNGPWPSSGLKDYQW